MQNEQLRLTEETLVKHLLSPICYPHPVNTIEMKETHISWVFLAGEYAYKLKKPVNLGFLDFSSLQKRHTQCLEELRLNRFFAPNLYLDVVPIGGSPTSPRIGITPAMDYLVKMKRFDGSQQFDTLLQRKKLQPSHLQVCASWVARFHHDAAPATESDEFGSYQAVVQPAFDNFSQIRELPIAKDVFPLLSTIEEWSHQEGEKLREIFRQRKDEGHIRECHGDMHLGNMVWIDEKPLLFDCIEFNPSLRIIDTMNDVAFLLMDLHSRNQHHLAATFLDSYIQEAGDFEGLKTLPFYLTYRAMVRAKVNAIQGAQLTAAANQEPFWTIFRTYLELASRYLTPSPPRLFLTHGFSGSGKTTFVNALAPHLDAICLHSDRERKRSKENQADREEPDKKDMYSAINRASIYSSLASRTEAIVEAGRNVIVDATFLNSSQRQRFRDLADKHKIQCTILDFPRAAALLEERLAHRKTAPDRFSDADVSVLEQQMASHDPLLPQEQNSCITITPQDSLSTVQKRIQETRAPLP